VVGKTRTKKEETLHALGIRNIILMDDYNVQVKGWNIAKVNVGLFSLLQSGVICLSFSPTSCSIITEVYPATYPQTSHNQSAYPYPPYQ
jgi:hypothetical protein